MARLFFTGWEAGDTTAGGIGFAEGGGSTGAFSATVVSTSPHGGGFRLDVVTASAATAGQDFPAFTGATARDYFLRVYVRKTANPANALDLLILAQAGGSRIASARLNTNGTVTLIAADGTTVIGSASAALNNGQWYRVEFRAQVNTATTGVTELRIDGSTVTGTNVSNANLGTVAPGQVSVGWTITGVTSTATISFDDLAVNDGTGTQQNTWPGDGKIVHLDPTADSAIGTGWTKDNAVGAPMFGAVDAKPPLGIADTTAGDGTHQIRNATSNANSAYNPTLETYTAAGVGSADTLQCMAAVAITGAPSATSAKSGSMRILSNPVDPGLVSIGTFYQGAATAGTYKTGWIVKLGTIYDRSNANLAALTSANYGTAPTMSLNQVTASTRIAMCCLMYVRVEYLPGVAAEVIPNVVMAPLSH